MQITSNPALPAHCIRCVGSVREQYVDTEVQLDFYGAILVCTFCVIEMGSLIGMASPELAKHFRNQAEEFARERFELKRQVAGLEAAVDGLARARGFAVPGSRDSGVLFPDAQGQGAEPPGSGDDVSIEGTRLDRGTGATSEPSDDEYVAGLRSDDSNDAGRSILNL